MTAWRETLQVWTYSFFKLPLIFWLRPRVERITNQESILKITLRRRTRNHVGAMYFGALCVGAELTAGILAIQLFKTHKKRCTLLFKDFHADFLKRCEGDVIFTCRDGDALEKAISAINQDQPKQQVAMSVVATVPDCLGDVPAATFHLTMAIKLTPTR